MLIPARLRRKLETVPKDNNLPDETARVEVDGLVVPAPEPLRRCRRLSLNDVFLGFAGYQDSEHPVHQAIAAPHPGDPLQVRMGTDHWGEALRQRDGGCAAGA